LKINVSSLLQLEHNCRNAQNYAELKYLIVNETNKLIPYDQAVLLVPNYRGKLKVESISDIQAIDKTAPFVQNIESVSKKILKRNNTLHVLDYEKEINSYEKEYFQSNNYSNLLWMPLKIKKDDMEFEYYLILFKKEEWNKNQLDVCSHLSSSFAYFLYGSRKCKFRSNSQKSWGSLYFKLLFIILIAAMFIPIKLTVLAPLEVVAKDPFIVTSSLDGVIDEIKVKPNEFVKKDTLIVKLNDIEYSNKYLIAQKTLDLAKVKLKAAQQASFYDLKQKNSIDKLKAEVELKQSELEFTKEQLEKTLIYAKKDGVAIVHNPNEWKGKPVVTGERILQIANENSIELKIMMPVSDAIFLEDTTKIKAFLDNDPLNTWEGSITNISYKPELTPSNILAYKITAKFDNLSDSEYKPSIGLRGTAKIYSHEVSLFFYLFKKPITSLRQLLGW